MPLAAIRAYLLNLDAMQAEANLQAVQVADFPHLAPATRDARFRKWQRAIAPAQQQPAKPAPIGLLAMVGIGYRHSPPSSTIPKSEATPALAAARKCGASVESSA